MNPLPTSLLVRYAVRLVRIDVACSHLRIAVIAARMRGAP